MTTTTEISLGKTAVQYSEGRRILKVFFGRKLAVIGLVIIVLLIITAIAAPWLAPYNPYTTDVAHRLQSPSTQHLLGTDSIGRDILSRVIYGARTSLLVGLGAVGLATLVGQALGLIAGYFGGLVHHIIMRLIDALMAIPMILIAMILASVLGGGIRNVILALAVGMVSGHCRMMCAQVLSVKQNDYILAGRAVGMSNLRLMLSEIMPNAYSPLFIVITIGLGAAILAEASLSYLGIGIPITIPSWGGMVNDGQKYLFTNPIIAFAPGVAIMLTVFGFNMMGDGLRDALDPRLRGVI
jgi:ABC-type dipeptide/oligopeptide/nickel transport system permease subunit